MARERSSLRLFIYLLISVILPILGILINHLYRPDNIVLTLFLVVWMGFFLMVFAPFESGEDELVEP